MRDKGRERLEGWVSAQNPSKEGLLNGLNSLHEHFVQVEDEVRVRKCEGLIEKLKEDELIFAFCGHFSAGKSTMINALVGEELLPSNPIPTSANVVKVKTGEPKAVVGFKEKGVQTFPYPYDREEIQQYCTDGDAVDFVEISHPEGKLPAGTAILDTPGIDSNNDAHRVAARSRLYTADVVIYVMDYHHVQSQVNVDFIKELQAQAKPTFLVVNQIDKHVTAEISFMIFRKRIEDAFEQAGADYDQLFFTSMKDEEFAHNEFSRLKERLAEMMQQRKATVLKTVLRESRLLIDEHIEWKESNYNDEIEMLVESLGAFHTVEGLKGLLEELKERYVSPRGKREQFERTFEQRFERLLENANIMPYHTREGARSFLESRQTGFQVSGLFKKRKVKEEKHKRLDRFHNDLVENVKVYVDIHLKKLFEEMMQHYHIYDEKLRKDIHDFRVKVDKELLEKHVNKGALLSGESLLNYCSQVRKDINRLYKQKTLRWIEQISMQVEKKANERLERIHEEEERLHRKLKAAERLEAIEAGRKRLFDQLIMKISDQSGSTEQEEDAPSVDVERFRKATMTTQQAVERVHIGEVSNSWLAERAEKEAKEQSFDQEHVVHQLEQAAALLRDVKGFDYQSDQLQRRAQTLTDRSFTVALFGAFSAGKSSFANALLQEEVLPVSPNPTTAAINHISAPDEQHPHETLVMKFKTESELLEDVNHLLRQHQHHLLDLTELSGLLSEHAQRLAKWRAEEERLQEKAEEDEKKREEDVDYPPLFFMDGVELSFLHAVADGLHEFMPSLGREVITDRSELEAYTAVEERACFIESVQLYYDCELTRQGITLVDTPGADSMNARHTEVSFDYVTNADAVLFITYYNHAFSRADKEFLTQLGRVKDYFTQDKMFFVVNAADLAEKRSELFDVLKHVEGSLLECGIRNARLYPVSSHIALYAEKDKKGQLGKHEQSRYEKLTGWAELPEPQEGLSFSGVAAFRESFEPFVLEELASVVSKQAVRELHQSAAQLEEWISIERDSEAEREHKLAEAERTRTEITAKLEGKSFQIEYELVEREVEELLYYAKQRLFFRHGDEFKALFTPMSFFENETLRTSLLRCTSELLKFTSRDLAQEMRAAAFRTETFVIQTGQTCYTQAEQLLREHGETLSFAQEEFARPKRPQFAEGLQEIQPEQFEGYIKQFQSTAAFFAEEAHKQLRERIELALHEPVNQYVAQAEQRLKETYLTAFDQYRTTAKAAMIEQVHAHFDGKAAVLTDKQMLHQYKHVYIKLAELLRR